jgi:hypothetical protein
MLSQSPSFRGSVRPAALGDLPPSEGGEAPTGAGADRRTRRERPAHDAGRRAYRRSTAAFSLDLETAFWKRTGAPIRYALDSAEFFALRSSAPTSPLPDGPT